jgi:hypothetical protein
MVHASDVVLGVNCLSFLGDDKGARNRSNVCAVGTLLQTKTTVLFPEHQPPKIQLVYAFPTQEHQQKLRRYSERYSALRRSSGSAVRAQRPPSGPAYFIRQLRMLKLFPVDHQKPIIGHAGPCEETAAALQALSGNTLANHHRP